MERASVTREGRQEHEKTDRQGSDVAAIVTITLALAAIATNRPPARANGNEAQCLASCAMAKRDCIQAAVMARDACSDGCVGADAPEVCVHECQDTVHAARDVCKLAVRECRDACVPPPSCEEGCGTALGTCLLDAVNQGGTCASDCLVAAATARDACASAEHPLACMLEVAKQLGECLDGCSEGLRGSREGCVATFRNCRENCPTGSPSGAFLESND